jgi:hypothetical protein
MFGRRSEEKRGCDEGGDPFVHVGVLVDCVLNSFSRARRYRACQRDQGNP